VNTPRQLNRNNPEIRQAIGEAVNRLDEAGIALDARLGDHQQAIRNDERIEIHGGPEAGIFNYINSPWNPTEVDGRTVGYPDTTYGSSFVMTAEFTEDGPNAYGILTYSLSTDPTSPWFGDQTPLYSRKEWVRLRLTESEIEDGKLFQYTVHG
jgi:acyl-homoserine-lactone acylase